MAFICFIYPAAAPLSSAIYFNSYCYNSLNYEMQFPLKMKAEPKPACQRRVWNFPAISDNHFANKQLKNLIRQQTVDIIG